MRCLGCRWDGTGQEFMLVYWEKPWAVNVESTMFFSWVMWALRAALIGNQPQQIKGHTIAIGSVINIKKHCSFVFLYLKQLVVENVIKSNIWH